MPAPSAPPAPLPSRVRRELRTVERMIAMRCREVHGGGACRECEDLGAYVRLRVDRCPFGPAKATCARCTVHCYRPDMRERIRAVMRFAGPRMAWRHPILSLLHLLDGRRPVPVLPGRAP